jgi:CRISPR/Cas system-associated exonuclease Cas4 (RecB family)
MLYKNVHPLLKAKFSSPERLPYYNLYRERAALYASQVVQTEAPEGLLGFLTTGSALQRTEVRLESADGLIVGRPDYIDMDAQSVVDYKSGVSDNNETDAVSDAEIRQLRLYAYLASEAGISVSKGVIVRGDGRRSQIEIPKSQAAAEGSRAKGQLQAINAALADGQSFDGLASPSVENCPMCPCLPFCDAFWRECTAEWADRCGVHVEGLVKEVSSTTAQGVPLVTLRIELQRGTLNSTFAFIEQIPEKWLTIEGASIPKVGDIVRVVHARQFGDDHESANLRVDKGLTNLWSVLPAKHAYED